MLPFALLIIGEDHFFILLFGFFPLALLLAIVGMFFGIIIFFTSNSKKPPIYHFIFVILSFIFSVLWLYRVADELVAVLQSYLFKGFT
jgi:solute carrier family 24 (sodium/potassium/calcium exchanger), member 6